MIRGIDNLLVLRENRVKRTNCAKLMKTKNTKKIKVPEADYQMLRRDKRTKKEVKALALMLFDKVKNWK